MVPTNNKEDERSPVIRGETTAASVVKVCGENATHERVTRVFTTVSPTSAKSAVQETLVPYRQPRILLSKIEARSVNVKYTTTTTTHCMDRCVAANKNPCHASAASVRRLTVYSRTTVVSP